MRPVEPDRLQSDWIGAMLHNSLETKILKLLTKLRASGHAIDVDGLAHSIHADHRDIGLQVIRDRIHVHMQRLRGITRH